MEPAKCSAAVLSQPARNFGLVGVASFVFEAIGLFGNAVSVSALIGRFLKKDVFQYFLRVLCLVNMGTLVCAMFMFTLHEFVLCTAPSYDVLSIVNTTVLISFPLGHMLKTCSSWLVAIMSAYRFVYIKHPLRFVAIGRRDVARSVVACIGIFSFIFNITRMLELAMDKCVLPNGRLFSLIVPTALRNTTSYQIGYLAITETTVGFVLPLSVILVCNFYMVALLCQSTFNKTELGRRAVLKGHSATLLLASVGWVFFVCNISSFLATILELLIKHGWYDDLFAYAVVSDVSNFLTVANATINFFLFLAYSHRFRTAVATKLTSWRGSQTGNSQRGSGVHFD